MTKDEILKLEEGRQLDWAIQERVIREPISKWMNYPPHYSTEIDAAWEVVEKFPVIGIYSNSVNGKWQVNIRGCVAEGDTAPLAICRAALITTLE